MFTIDALRETIGWCLVLFYHYVDTRMLKSYGALGGCERFNILVDIIYHIFVQDNFIFTSFMLFIFCVCTRPCQHCTETRLVRGGL